jgi:hypothetical protein
MCDQSRALGEIDGADGPSSAQLIDLGLSVGRALLPLPQPALLQLSLVRQTGLLILRGLRHTTTPKGLSRWAHVDFRFMV